MKSTQRPPLPSGSLSGNDILSALLNSEYRRLEPKLDLVELWRGQVIYKADQRIRHVYFPQGAVVAMVDTLDSGGTVEVGVIGNEGMVGINIFLGCMITPDKAIVQIAGNAMRMKTSDLRNELRFGSPLQRLLLRYTQALLAVISQSVACSQHHLIAPRLAPWLLTMRDYSRSGTIEMSQAHIAAMLGTRREGVTEAALKFQAEGLISYSRGKIFILNDAGLKKISCECYRFIKKQFGGVIKDVPKVLGVAGQAVVRAGKVKAH